MNNQTIKDIKDIRNLSLSWLVIIVSGFIGWSIGNNSNEVIGYFVSAIIAVFITLLIWYKE